MKELLSRRTILKGLGASIALPFLEAMMPQTALATPVTWAGRLPRRMAFLYVPNGVNMQEFMPRDEGFDFALPSSLAPLEPFKDDMLALSGLTVDKARANGDGPGDHARAMSAFLTGCQPRKTAGADIRAGISVDQVAATRVGSATRFPSLEIGCEGGRQAGSCDSGYSCAYSNNISWRSEATPQPKETNPRAVFDRLFGGPSRDESGRAAEMRAEFNRSILDFVRDDARELNGRLGLADQRRMDEYLTSIRDVERRIQDSDIPAPAAPAGATRPTGTPSSYRDHLRLMGDLMALAFQTDVTRVGTFVFANEGSNRPYREITISDGHHDLSHHANNREKLEKIARINLFHVEQLAYFLGRLKDIREGDGALLDNCMVLYGSGNGDGNRHNHDELPILLFGKGGGSISTGRHVRYARNTPLCNLFLCMLDRVGVEQPRFGDSTGRLNRLSL